MTIETIENKNLIEVKEVNKEEELVKTINDFCDKLNIFCFKNKIEKHQENSNTRIISDVTADIIKKLHSMQNITLDKRIEAIKDYLKELKVLLRDEILKNQNIELKDFILKLGLILNSVFGEEKTEEETKILSLVVVEQVKEEPKAVLAKLAHKFSVYEYNGIKNPFSDSRTITLNPHRVEQDLGINIQESKKEPSLKIDDLENKILSIGALIDKEAKDYLYGRQ